jgi:hypothetical protein
MKQASFCLALSIWVAAVLTSPALADEAEAEKALEKLHVRCVHGGLNDTDPIFSVEFDDIQYQTGDLKKALPYLKQLKKLERVKLPPAVADDELALLAELKDLDNLNEVTATESKVSDAGLLRLKPLKKLRVINVIGAKGVTEKGARRLLKEIPSLEVVFIKLDDGIRR